MVAHHPDAEHPAHIPELHTTQQHLQHLPLFAKELLAGGVAGGLAKTSVAPLERCKILFQTGRMSGRGVGDTLRAIYQSEGPRGFFRGNGASVLRIVPYAAVHFTAYERFRALLLDVVEGFERGQEAERAGAQQSALPSSSAGQHRQVSPVLDLVAGSAAGATAVLLTYPLDLVRTRLAYGMDTGPSAAAKGPANIGAAGAASARVQAGTAAPDGHRGNSSGGGGGAGGATAGRQPSQHGAASSTSSLQPHKLNIRGVLRQTLRTEGAMGLYRGIGPTVVGILPYAGLKFYVYQSLKQQYRAATGRDEEHRLPVPLMLTFGAISGLIGQTVTYPLDLVRRRMQVQALAAAGAPALGGTWAALRGIVRSAGWRGLFSGLSINYMKVVPSTAIGFTLYDSAKQFLGLKGNI